MSASGPEDPPGDGDWPEEPVVVPITDELDLHSFSPRQVVSVVEEYLWACREKGLLRVRVVHGRGRGVQRAEVRRLLSRVDGVVSFADAPPSSGGWGATLVELSPPPPTPESEKK